MTMCKNVVKCPFLPMFLIEEAKCRLGRVCTNEHSGKILRYSLIPNIGRVTAAVPGMKYHFGKPSILGRIGYTLKALPKFWVGMLSNTLAKRITRVGPQYSVRNLCMVVTTSIPRCLTAMSMTYYLPDLPLNCYNPLLRRIMRQAGSHLAEVPQKAGDVPHEPKKKKGRHYNIAVVRLQATAVHGR